MDEVSSAQQPDGAIAWTVAADRLANAHTYWLATVRKDGPPHVMPVWAVWLDGCLWLSTSGESIKGRNLAREPRCTVTLDEAGMQLVVECTARRVTDEGELRRFAQVYSAKYDWPMTIKDDAIHFDDGNSGYVYAVHAETVFAFIEEPFTTAKWRF